MKKKILLPIVVMVILGIGVIFCAKEQKKVLSENKYRKVAENIEDSIDGTENTIVKAKDFNLSLEEVKSRYQLQNLSETGDADEANEVLQECIEEYSWYQNALDNGYDYSDKEAQEEVEKIKESLEVSENKEEVEKYIATFSSEEKYWEYVKERNIIKGTINKYENALKEEFCSENSISEEKVDSSTEWNNYLENEKQLAVEKQNVQIQDKMVEKIEY